MPEPTDQRLRFLLPHAGVRGVAVHLVDAWAGLLQAASYPPRTRELLGQAVAATALLGGHVKLKGRLSLQLRGSGALRTLFAECTAAGTVRGIVQLEAGADAPADLTALGEDAVLAVTIENPGLDPNQPQRYQSLVALQAPTLDELLEDYFRQSEQLPTRLLLAADGDRAAGLMLQQLPFDSRPGDGGDQDGWRRAGLLFDTLAETELLETAPAVLLGRLFQEEGLSLLDARPLRFGCSCSRERVEGMLQSLGREEALAAAETGQAEVTCEFCGRRYLFSPAQIAGLFTGPLVGAAPEQLQ
ncbi:MAG: Hsp33 family molecular chaperone HslO [Pseudoxanthomonas sp.]